MSHAAVRARPGQDRASLYQEITDRIVVEIEVGRLPWVQPWGTSAVQAPLSMPKNAATQRRYFGIHVLILWGAVVQHGFPGQSWLTFRQALGMGGNVRNGQRGATVVFADRFIPGQERARAREQDDKPSAISFLQGLRCSTPPSVTRFRTMLPTSRRPCRRVFIHLVRPPFAKCGQRSECDVTYAADKPISDDARSIG